MNMTFLTGTNQDGQFPHRLKIEVDRQTAFGIIEKLNAFIENIPSDSHKATFLNFAGELAIEQGKK